MKNFSKVMGFLLIALMVISFAGCSKEVGVWGTNYDEACKKAEATETNVLVFFSKLESDTISQQLNELFSTPKFESKVGKYYQLVNIDIPESDGIIDYDQMIANFELASKFAVEALPTVVLTTPEGYVIGSNI